MNTDTPTLTLAFPAAEGRDRPAPIEAWCPHATPLGSLQLAATRRGLAGAWFAGQQHHPGAIAAPEDPQHPLLARARGELDAWFADAGCAFTLPLDPAGTPFQHAVWAALLAIPPGGTTSYGDIAARAGRAGAARATGAAIGRNPLSVIVPCHRVLGHAGAITGYAGGLHRKRWLLAHEARAQETRLRLAARAQEAGARTVARAA
jgi:methylated-DNA-[protein]-cysteine S-methyltransferase